MRRTKDWFTQLPLSAQVSMKAFVPGAGLGLLVAAANVVGFLRTDEGLRGEVVELGAYWTYFLGFPLSVFIEPALFLVPWAWMVLVPGLNLALIALACALLYQGANGLRNRLVGRSS